MLAPGSGALSHFEFLSPGSWPLSGPGSTFRAAGRRSDGQRSTRSLAAGPRAVQGWHADGTLPLPPSQQPRVLVPTALRPAASANAVPAGDPPVPLPEQPITAHPDHLPAWALTPNIPVLYCPKARHQTTGDSPYVPEPLNLLLKPADPKAAHPASLVPS